MNTASCFRNLLIQKLRFVDSKSFWVKFCFVTASLGVFMFMLSWVLKNYDIIAGIFGGFLIVTAWIGYCVLEGIKREQIAKEEMAKSVPYKVETPSEPSLNPSGG